MRDVKAVRRLWRRLRTERNDATYPNPAGGLAGLLFPYRRLVTAVAIVLILVLVVVSVLT